MTDAPRNLKDCLTTQAMRNRLERLRHGRADLRVLHYMLGPERFLEWAHAIGVLGDEELAAVVPPWPPVELRGLTAAPHIEEFLWTGYVDTAQVLDLYQQHRSDADPFPPAVLDFGCGCGRMLRFLSRLDPPWPAHGCDVRAANANWCDEHIDGVPVVQNGVLPPTEYPDATFNLVFGLSILTHLTESGARRWLDEFARILAPCGTLIITTHGTGALDVIAGSEVHQRMFGLDRSQAVRLRDGLARDRFVFLRYDPATLGLAEAGEDYGNAFIHRDYIDDEWNRGAFTVRTYLPAGLRGWQDIVVLRRNGSASG